MFLLLAPVLVAAVTDQEYTALAGLKDEGVVGSDSCWDHGVQCFFDLRDFRFHVWGIRSTAVTADIQNVATHLQDLPYLGSVSLRGSPDLMGDFPQSLAEMNLYTLILKDTGIQGTLPPAIFENSNLEELDLSGTPVVGELPATIQYATNLETLNLANTRLDGIIPDLEALEKLKTLRLEDSLFNGAHGLAPSGVARCNVHSNTPWAFCSDDSWTSVGRCDAVLDAECDPLPLSGPTTPPGQDLCNNQQQDFGEEGIDCGGPCYPCVDPVHEVGCADLDCENQWGGDPCTIQSDSCVDGACHYAPQPDGKSCGVGLVCKAGVCVDSCNIDPDPCPPLRVGWVAEEDYFRTAQCYHTVNVNGTDRAEQTCESSSGEPRCSFTSIYAHGSTDPVACNPGARTPTAAAALVGTGVCSANTPGCCIPDGETEAYCSAALTTNCQADSQCREQSGGRDTAPTVQCSQGAFDNGNCICDAERCYAACNQGAPRDGPCVLESGGEGVCDDGDCLDPCASEPCREILPSVRFEGCPKNPFDPNAPCGSSSLKVGGQACGSDNKKCQSCSCVDGRCAEFRDSRCLDPTNTHDGTHPYYQCNEAHPDCAETLQGVEVHATLAATYDLTVIPQFPDPIPEAACAKDGGLACVRADNADNYKCVPVNGFKPDGSICPFQAEADGTCDLGMCEQATLCSAMACEAELECQTANCNVGTTAAGEQEAYCQIDGSACECDAVSEPTEDTTRVELRFPGFANRGWLRHYLLMIAGVPEANDQVSVVCVSGGVDTRRRMLQDGETSVLVDIRTTSKFVGARPVEDIVTNWEEESKLESSPLASATVISKVGSKGSAPESRSDSGLYLGLALAFSVLFVAGLALAYKRAPPKPTRHQELSEYSQRSGEPSALDEPESPAGISRHGTTQASVISPA